MIIEIILTIVPTIVGPHLPCLSSPFPIPSPSPFLSSPSPFNFLLSSFAYEFVLSYLIPLLSPLLLSHDICFPFRTPAPVPLLPHHHHPLPFLCSNSFLHFIMHFNKSDGAVPLCSFPAPHLRESRLINLNTSIF